MKKRPEEMTTEELEKENDALKTASEILAEREYRRLEISKELIRRMNPQ